MGVFKTKKKGKGKKMTLTQKENSLLCDLKSQESLCIEKYSKYASEAHDPCLKALFEKIKGAEMTHLDTVNKILSGEEVSMPAAPSATAAKAECSPSSLTESERGEDAFLCRDALAMEKHVSSVYDVSVFEFSSPTLRDTLSHIQKEEQNHGLELYSYMSSCGMYS